MPDPRGPDRATAPAPGGGGTADTDREGRVLEAVVDLVDSLLDDFDVVDLLTDLTEQCAALLDIDTAGLLLADLGHRLHLMAATSESLWNLELFQLQSAEGPCLDCFRKQRPVSVADLTATADRWPVFAPAALATGVRSVHAIPMRAAGQVVGTLGLFASTTGSLSPADVAVGQTLAHVATVALLQEHARTPDAVLGQLEQALTARTTVEQAKGFVHEKLHVDTDRAFVLLRTLAREQRLHLTDVARSLLYDRSARPTIVAGLERLAASAP